MSDGRHVAPEGDPPKGLERRTVVSTKVSGWLVGYAYIGPGFMADAIVEFPFKLWMKQGESMTIDLPRQTQLVLYLESALNGHRYLLPVQVTR